MLNKEIIIEWLTTGDFDQFLQQRENQYLEAKPKRPYEIDQPSTNTTSIAKFATDVASLANSEGGFIICGLNTQKFGTNPHDVVTSLELQAKGNFYVPHVLQSILNKVIFPRIQIKVSWYPSAKNSGLGLGVLEVPQKAKKDKYILVRTVDCGDKVRSNSFFGVPIRKGDVTDWLKVQDIHALLQLEPTTIEKMQQAISDELKELKDMISLQLPASPPPSTLLAEKIRETLENE